MPPFKHMQMFFKNQILVNISIFQIYPSSNDQVDMALLATDSSDFGAGLMETHLSPFPLWEANMLVANPKDQFAWKLTISQHFPAAHWWDIKAWLGSDFHADFPPR